MRVMTQKQEALFEELLKLAGGDPLLLEKALRTYSSKGEIPEEMKRTAEKVRLARKKAQDTRQVR